MAADAVGLVASWVWFGNSGVGLFALWFWAAQQDLWSDRPRVLCIELERLRVVRLGRWRVACVGRWGALVEVFADELPAERYA